jgi:hypothetical protein
MKPMELIVEVLVWELGRVELVEVVVDVVVMVLASGLMAFLAVMLKY